MDTAFLLRADKPSCAGGGTNLLDHYRTGDGAVISCAIKKCVCVTVSKRFDNDMCVNYYKTEIVDSVDKLEQRLVREALKRALQRTNSRLPQLKCLASRPARAM